MNKKILFVFLLGFILGGCEKKKVEMQAGPSEIKVCQEEEVAIVGYGDKGKRLTNCFVEYPGEPTRQDKSYYIVEDICGQFTREFVENIVGQNIINLEEFEDRQTFGCKYNLSTGKFVTITLGQIIGI
jgi:hypothetical protein